MQRVFQQAYHIAGTLAANITIVFTSPMDCTLLHVSAVASNASSATFTVGDTTDVDEYLTASDVGDSDVPAEYDGNDFVDTAGVSHNRYYPRISDGTIVKIAVDYDGASGTAANDLTIVLTFAEG